MKLTPPLFRLMPELVKSPLRAAREVCGWPMIAHCEFWRDVLFGLGDDPGTAKVVEAGLKWLSIAQDCSSSADGGVARHYSLITGWSTSYPETTGYIIPTFIEHARRSSDSVLLARVRRMLDWLVTIQFENGGFQGSSIGVSQVVPVTFDTGQILQGLAAGVSTFGDSYMPALRSAAGWLMRTQDSDGCWRNPNPFVDAKNDYVFETHVAWGLLEAARVDPGQGFEATALRNIDWAITHQCANGWFEFCCLSDPLRPLTHTLAYALRGVIEGWLYSRNERYLQSACLAADGLLGATDSTGRIAGRLDCDWNSAVSWVCLTGSSQIAICWLLLYKETGDNKYRDAAYRVNEFVRRTIRLKCRREMAGGVKGAFPISGNYGRFQFLNWACKFMIDANTLEEDIRSDDV